MDNKLRVFVLFVTLIVCSDASFFLETQIAQQVHSVLEARSSNLCTDFVVTGEKLNGSACLDMGQQLQIRGQSIFSKFLDSDVINVNLTLVIPGFKLTGNLSADVNGEQVVGTFDALALDNMYIDLSVFHNYKLVQSVVRTTVRPASKFIHSVQWNCPLSESFRCPAMEKVLVKSFATILPVMFEREINKLMHLNQDQIGRTPEPPATTLLPVTATPKFPYVTDPTEHPGWPGVSRFAQPEGLRTTKNLATSWWTDSFGNFHNYVVTEPSN